MRAKEKCPSDLSEGLVIVHHLNEPNNSTLFLYFVLRVYIEYFFYFVVATKPDPNAPRPEGQTLRPVTGESLEVHVPKVFNDLHTVFP